MKIVLLLCLILYFVPAVVAFVRGHRQRMPILLLNVFLGWSVIGWIGAMIWAAANPSSGALPPGDRMS